MLRNDDIIEDTDDAAFPENPHTFDVDEISSLIHDNHKQSRISLQYENIIQACGFGRFQVILLVVCGWSFVSDAAEVQVVSFVLPAACDLEMTSSQKGWLNAIIFVGMMIGGYTFGGSADLKGRRLVLLFSMSINGIFGLISAFAPTFSWFLGFRFLSGIGVGAALPVLFSYFAEFLSKEHRGPMIGLLACFLMVGNIMTSSLAWMIIPSDKLSGYVNSVFVGSWRVFVGICSIPALTASIMFYYMPESPKFLLKMGQAEKAEVIFTRIYHINCNDKNKPVPSIISQCTIHDDEDMSKISHKIEGISVGVIEVLKATRSLFRKNLKSPTVTLVIVWFALSFGYYGLWMWLPEIFRRIEDGGSSCNSSIGQSFLAKSNSSHQYNDKNSTVLSPLVVCDRDNGIYLQTFLVALSNLPGNILTVTTIDKIGRRNLLGVSMLLSAIAVFFFQLVHNRVEMMLMACIFSGLSIIAWNVLNAVALENYPTYLRSTAFGIQTSVGRIASILANIVFGVLVDVHCAVPLVLVASFLLIGGIAVFFLPRTDDQILL